MEEFVRKANSVKEEDRLDCYGMCKLIVCVLAPLLLLLVSIEFFLAYDFPTAHPVYTFQQLAFESLSRSKKCGSS